MAKALLLFLLFFCTLSSFGQKRFSISGTIKDGTTGEQLIGATIRIKELPQSGTVTNSYGFYSIYAPEGDYTLLYTYTGYEAIEQKVLKTPIEGFRTTNCNSSGSTFGLDQFLFLIVPLLVLLFKMKI